MRNILSKLSYIGLFLSIISSCQSKEEKKQTNSNGNSEEVNNNLYIGKWLSINKEGNQYYYCTDSDRFFEINKDKIYDHTPMEDSDFNIDHIKEKGNQTFFYIDKQESSYYILSWVDKNKGIISYQFNKYSPNFFIAEKKIKSVNNKDCISSEESSESDRPTNTLSYSADGTWKTNCTEGTGSMTIEGKEASLVVLTNQIYIQLIETKRYDSEKGIAYKLKEIPEDLGTLGIKLPWKDYLNEQTIAYIKVIDDKTLNFYWYGFYNEKTGKREFKESNFNEESKKSDIVLKKCE